MKLFTLICLGLFSVVAEANVTFEINWNDQLRKEMIVSCEGESITCSTLCKNDFRCVIPEGYCRDCIGTSLTMNNLISELGRTIVNVGNFALKMEVLDLLQRNRFVTLTANDVYNVIDGANSVRAFKKFEKLCPTGSYSQIVILEVDEYTRKILGPRFVHCEQPEGSFLFELTTRPDVVIQEAPLSYRILY